MFRRTPRTRAFTLVELLAVIAIIVLLLGILVPALSAARDQAKKTSTLGMFKAIGTGCEQFSNEMNGYPKSFGVNPFTENDPLSGAQWLVVQLSGPDLRGYVKPDRKNDTDNDEDIDSDDWNNWYALDAPDYPRIGPFVDAGGGIAQNITQYKSTNPTADEAPAPLDDVSGDWTNGKIPFYVDAFRFPVLYYAANAQAKYPFMDDPSSRSGAFGVYDQSDNAQFTGGDGSSGRNSNSYEGWNVNGSSKTHTLKELGWSKGNPNDRPERETFAGYLYDENTFETTNNGSDQGRVWPRKSDSYLLISPGRDGLYGTDDDVTNF